MDLMYGLKPVPFRLNPVPFRLKPVPFKLTHYWSFLGLALFPNFAVADCDSLPQFRNRLPQSLFGSYE